MLQHVEGRPGERCISEIPRHILDTLSLYERMNVSFNTISDLPAELPLRLPHLSYLDLSHNQLRGLPDSIGLLLHLETLLLKHNQLRRLPPAVFHLIKLKKLDLSYNSLKSIANEFLTLESLEKLNVSKNRLKNLPTSLGGLKTLKVLLASDNKFSQPLHDIAASGSDELLSYLRKTFNLTGAHSEQLALGNNIFPRVRGNHLQTSVPNPHSAQVQYIQSQTHTANTSSRIKTPLLPPPGASQLEALTLRDRILGIGCYCIKHFLFSD